MKRIKKRDTCTRKRLYTTKEQAKEGVLHIMQNSGVDEAASYICPFCKGFHVTSHPLKGADNEVFKLKRETWETNQDYFKNKLKKDY